MSIFISLIGLSFIIFIHELGHFIAAKFFKVDVETFSIGFGPALIKKKIKETTYQISPILLGGFVRIKGSDYLINQNPQAKEEKNSLLSLHPLKRAIIYFFGPLFNFILSFFLFLIISLIGIEKYYFSNQIYTYQKSTIPSPIIIKQGNHFPVESYEEIINYLEKDFNTITYEYENTNHSIELQLNSQEFQEIYLPLIPLVIQSIIPNSPAMQASLQANDKILKINNEKVFSIQDIQKFKPKNLNFNLLVLRDGKEENITLNVKDFNSNWGIEFHIDTKKEKANNFLEAISLSFQKMKNFIIDFYKSLFSLFAKDSQTSISGPIGITKVINQPYQIGFLIFLNILSQISLILALMNLLPIPIVDGGQIIINIIESIYGRALNKKIIYFLMSIGLLFIFFMMSIGIYNDINNLIP